MTATETSFDLGQIAVIAEAHTPAVGSLSVEVTSIEALRPEVGRDGFTIEHGAGVIVFVPLGSPAPDFVDGLVQHIAGQFRLAAVPTPADAIPSPTTASAVGMRSDDGSGVAVYLTSGLAGHEPTHDPAAAPNSGGLITLGMLREVPLEVSAELGRARMSVSEILQLNVGSIIELDRTAGSPVDVVVNGSLIARGEVVVIDDEYGIRITEILGRVSDSL